jgi:transcription initiation factor IIE alpha subunit
MSNLPIWQSRITEYTKQITAINSEITTIDSETPTDSAIISMLATRKASLQDKITSLNRMLAVFQSKYDEESAIASHVFTSEQQAIIDSIDPQCAKYVDELKKMSSTKQNEFFDLYTKASNSTQQNCVFCYFFNV